MICLQINNKLAYLLGLYFVSLSFNCFAKQPHTIYFLEDFTPYIYSDEKQQPSGLLAEIALKALAESGVEYKLIPNNVKRLFKEIKKGGNVSTLGVYKTPERESWSIMSPELYRPPQPVLIVKRSKLQQVPTPLTIKALKKQLDNQTLTGVIMKDYSYGNWFDGVLETELNQIPRYQLGMQRAFKMVASPLRADFTLAYPAQARYLIEQDSTFQDKLSLVPFSNVPPNDTGAYWMFSKDSDPVLIKKIENAMEKVRQSDFYKQTVKKYTE